MGLVLFAIIGAKLQLGVAYWICFGILASLRVTKFAIDFFKAVE